MIQARQTQIIDGLPLSFIVATSDTPNKNPATIFLHGWGGEAESFQPLWEALAQQQPAYGTLIAIDLPGFGHTPPPPVPWGITDYAECVVKYLDAQQIAVADLVCHSFGGRIATKLLTLYPHRFRKVVYIAPAGILHHESRVTHTRAAARIIKPILQLPGLRTVFPFVQRIGYRLIGSHDYLKTSGVMRDTFKKAIAEDTAPLLESITQPAEIFWGRNDSYVPVADAEYMKQHMQHAHVTIFEEGRHGIHKTFAAQIAQRIAPFLFA